MMPKPGLHQTGLSFYLKLCYDISEVNMMKCLIPMLLCLSVLLLGCQPALEPTDTTVPSMTEGASLPTQAATEPPTTELPATEVSNEPLFDPYRIIDTMSAQELVGQLFLARCPSDSSAITDIKAYHLGGYILFGRDFENQTPDSMVQTLDSYQAASKLPMLIAVDEEGGTVTRVSSQSAFREAKFPSPRSLYEQGGLALVLQTEQEKCQLLSSVGINVNVAPVCDITTDHNAFMYSRSLGQSPQETGTYIASMVETMSANQIGGVLKHFPGYGNNTDTHVGIATDSRALEDLESCDLVPFQYGIEAGCDAIMVSHTFVQCLDNTLPASLSPAVIGYLRNAMGFQGVIVTDDLVMQAISDQYGAAEAAVLAVLAGNDLLCSSEYALQYTAVLDAVNTGRIPLTQVKDSVARLLQWKFNLGLLPID